MFPVPNMAARFPKPAVKQKVFHSPFCFSKSINSVTLAVRCCSRNNVSELECSCRIQEKGGPSERQKKDKPGSNSSQSLTIHLSWTTKSMFCDIKDYCTCPDLMSYSNKLTIDNKEHPRAFRAIRFCSICFWEFSYDFLNENSSRFMFDMQLSGN